MLYLRSSIDFDKAIEIYDEWFTPFARLRNRLRERGIAFHPRRGDVGFEDARGIPSTDGPPLVIYDRTDGGYLWWLYEPCGSVARRWLLSGRVAGLIKLSRYNALEHYNNPATDEALHARRIRHSSHGEVSPFGCEPRLQLDDRAYAKLQTCPGFWAFDVCRPQALWPLDLEAPRTLDVMCTITVRYECPAISWHRQQALHQLGQLSHLRVFLGRGRVLTLPTYHQLLRQTRICVSPWGWGESCFRDYEALLAGCVLIKPRTDFVDTLLPLDQTHHVSCEPDFSDLPQRVEQVLNNWGSYRQLRQKNREYVLAARNEDRLADQWAAAIRSAAATAE
jgi:hypothetical protein